ncbi:hypothetical protein QFZ27_005222 [Inquilinus ginsengisoli]|uniref:hypothetical protein n=1 Tax=Inquilinus ginsengisoli TaxID=363840 RepID=UPI003D1C90BA
MVRSEAFTIEVAGEAVGIVVAQKRGFRFYASDSRYQHLEGQDFRTVPDAERAARDLGRTVASPPKAVGIAS